MYTIIHFYSHYQTLVLKDPLLTPQHAALELYYTIHYLMTLHETPKPFLG